MVRVDTRAPKNLHGLSGFINRCLNLLTKAHVRHKIGTDIKDIKNRIKEVSERRDRYKVDNVVAKPVGQTIDSLRLSALYKKATELVGIEEKSDDLIKKLMVLKRRVDGAAKQQLKIVSIVGFGGLGKTTLANVVYQKFKVEFDCWAFVSVSLNPNKKIIMKEMLHQFGKSISEATWDEAQLIGEIREFLWNKRYLELMLDQWHESFQEHLLQCLSNLASLEILEMDGSNFRFLGFENLSPVPQQLRHISMPMCVIHAVPRWMSSLLSISFLRISLETLGVGDLQVLGSLQSLRDLTIYVKEPTQRLVIGSDYPFQCLTRFKFDSTVIEVVFAQGAMKKLQTLELSLSDVRQTIDRCRDFNLGLENLSSLGLVSVTIWGFNSVENGGFSMATHGDVEAAEAAIRKALETNSNKPTIELYKMRPILFTKTPAILPERSVHDEPHT